ncbi:MAG TPA: choice-of-anchor D domain-containing protein [Terriglobales bacterium]|nr:choice-of-anchor D domain-containing protein [Terriglobales bacterium]
MKRSACLFLSITLSLLAFISSCGGGSSNTLNQLNILVSVTESASTVQAGGTVQFIATVSNDSSNKGVSWTVSCPTAPCGTVSPPTTPSGVTAIYTAPAILTPGGFGVTVTANSVASPLDSDSAIVTVSADTISVSLANATVPVGTAEQLTATIDYDPAKKGISWSVSCASADCGSLNPPMTASGAATTYTAPKAFPAGDLSVTITATSAANPAITNSVDITVPGTTIAISATAGTVEIGGAIQLTATVTNDPENKGVTWTLSCSTAPCGMIAPANTASGTPTTYSAPNTPPASNVDVSITATSVFNGAVSTSTDVTFLAVTVSVTPIGALVPLSIALPVTATVGNDPSNAGVTWTATQSKTACSPGCGTVSPTNTSSGTASTYTAPSSAPASSTVTVTATTVEDATKSAPATVTVSSGTVELVPNTLNFGNVFENIASNPRQVVLTNVGASPLTIKSVNIAGTDPGDFSQTNNCGTSVTAAASCTLTLTFKPARTGARSAQVSISDSSSDSPQTITLSGTGITRRGAFLRATVRSALVANTVAAVPSPTGPAQVGTRVLNLMDSLRKDPYSSNGTARELLVRFWYPISQTTVCKPAAYTSQKVWGYFSELVGVKLPVVTTNSCLDAPMEEGSHPVVVFTPGYTATFTDYTFIAEDLASRGYVVASVDHTHEATAVEFPDGRLIKSAVGSHLGGPVRGDDQTLSFAVAVRLQDLRLVISELHRLNIKANSPFKGRFDLTRVSVAGHSMGGTTAFLAAERDTRIKAAVLLDAHVPESLIQQTRTPMLMMVMDGEKWSEDRCRLWSNLRGPRLAVNFPGAEHVTPSDAVWLAKDAVKTGAMDADSAVSAVRDYVSAFLDDNLRQPSARSLPTSQLPAHPGAEVVTEAQSVCGTR